MKKLGYIVNLRKRKHGWLQGGDIVFDEKRFKAALALAGVSQKELAQALGIDVSTLYRKIKAEGDFSRAEINTIINFLHIENPKDIFFATELA